MVWGREKNMSAFLFSIYLNDLNDYFNISNVQGLPTISEMLENCECVTYKILQELKCTVHVCKILNAVYFLTIILLIVMLLKWNDDLNKKSFFCQTKGLLHGGKILAQ